MIRVIIKRKEIIPICKNCHTRIDKFNSDRCPICGVEHPFEGVSSDTIEITTNIDTTNLDIEYNPRKRKTFLILYLTLGIFGVPFFYIYKKREGIISCLINVILLTLAIVLTAVFTNIHVALVIVMYLFAFIALNAFIGLYLYNMPNLKDGRGDFLN